MIQIKDFSFFIHYAICRHPAQLQDIDFLLVAVRNTRSNVGTPNIREVIFHPKPFKSPWSIRAYRNQFRVFSDK
jgi:hypothetical protein